MNYCNCPNCRTDNCPAVMDDQAHTEVKAELRRTQRALEYCLRTLKRHHLNKHGIAATVEETEWLLTPSPQSRPAKF